jgi:hypothetical protein
MLWLAWEDPLPDSTISHKQPTRSVLADRQPVGPNETGAKNALQRSKALSAAKPHAPRDMRRRERNWCLLVLIQ